MAQEQPDAELVFSSQPCKKSLPAKHLLTEPAQRPGDRPAYGTQRQRDQRAQGQDARELSEPISHSWDD